MVKKQQQKKATPFYALLALIAVIGVAAIGWLATRPKGAVTSVDPSVPVEAEGYLMGNPNAPVQVLEFADFECPACSQFATITEPDVRTRLVETGMISFRFYDFPLQMHPNTWEASHTAACANEQGKFWEMHDQLFNTQDRWNGIATRRPKGVFEDLARTIGLDMAKWEDCYDSRRYQRQIEANRAEAVRRNAGSTPTFVIGSRMIGAAIGYDAFKAYVDSALAEKGAAPGAAAAGDSAAKGAASPDSARPR